MTNVACTQCGSINILAAESCNQCGAELKYVVPPRDTWSPANPAEEYTEEPSGRYEARALAPEIGPFTGIGSVLSPTITIFKDNFWLILKITFLIFAPFEVFKAISIGRQPSYQVVIGGFFLWVFCQAIVTPALVYSLVQVMRTGTAPSLNDTYRFGLGKIGKLVATAGLAWILEMLGFICLIVPGIILGLGFQLIYPLVALEDLSPVEILKRSWNLTKGYKGSIFVAGFVAALLIGIVNIPVSIALAILPQASMAWLWQAAGALVSDVLSEATLVLSLVMYFSILRSKEPATVGQNDYYGVGSARTQLPPPPPVFDRNS
jgi:hypothetical protein